MDGLVMIGHKQDTDSEDESGDLGGSRPRVWGPRLGFGWLRCGFEDELRKKT